VAGVVTVLLLMAAGVALAFLILRPIGGRVTPGSLDVLYVDATAKTYVSGGVCTVSHTGGATGSLTVDWSGGLPGNTCEVAVSMVNPGASTGPAVLEGFDLDTDSPGALVATLNGDRQDDCGRSLAPGMTSPVTVTFTITDSAVLGAAIHLNAGTGFRWVPAPGDPSACT
jgi:hypothetical protein